MSLKTLISIKFVLYIIAYSSLTYLFWSVSDSFEALKNENERLLEQKQQYEQILKLNPKDVDDKKELYNVIKVSDSFLKQQSEKNKYSLDKYLWILFISAIIIYNIFYFLNLKIDTLKSEEGESEKEKLL